jgi:hypothetical protein
MQVRQRALQSTRLSRAPRVLCLHLNRTQWSPTTGYPFKVHGHVAFPVRMHADHVCTLLGAEDHGPAAALNRSLLPPQQQQHGVSGSAIPAATSLPSPSSSAAAAPQETSQAAGVLCAQDSEGDPGASCDDSSRKCQHDDSNSRQGQVYYYLRAVVAHLGQQSNSGHYLVYRQHAGALSGMAGTCKMGSDGGGEQAHSCWYRVSDSSVAAVSEQEVLSCQASVLLYEMVHVPPAC